MSKKISILADPDIVKSMFEEDFAIMKDTFLFDMLSENEISDLYHNDIFVLEDEKRIENVMNSYKNNHNYTRKRNKKRGNYVFTNIATKIKLPLTLRFNPIDKNITFKIELNYLFEKTEQ